MENMKTFLSIPFQTTPYAPLPSLRRISYFFPMWESISFEIGLDICTHMKRNRSHLKGQSNRFSPAFLFIRQLTYYSTTRWLLFGKQAGLDF